MKKPSPENLRFAVVSTDTIVFTLRDNNLLVRLIRVDRPPFFPNTKGLPGGLIAPKETAEEAAKRHIENKAGLSSKKVYLEQLYTFSRVDRDSRGRVVSVAHTALIPWEKLTASEKEDDVNSWWTKPKQAKKLAYDHDEMLSVALERIRSRIKYTTLISKMLPREFTLTDLEIAYENILGKKLDKRNFRKKILKLNIITPTASKRSGGRFRPAQLYKFTKQTVEEVEML